MAWSPAQSHDDFVSLAVSQPQSVVPRGPGYSLLGISCGKGAEARGGGVGSCRKKDMLVFGEAPVAGNDPKQFMLKGRHRCLEPFRDRPQSLSSVYRHNLSMGSFDNLGWAQYRQHEGTWQIVT